MSVNSKMTAIADAIRAKTGGSAALTLDGMASAIEGIPEKIDTSGTAVAADIYAGKTATVNDAKITGTNPYNAATVDPAVANALAALAEKGVDTTGAGLDALASLIASIEAGGAKFSRGSVTPASSALTMTIEHGLGVVPDIFLMVLRGSYSVVQYQYIYVGYYDGHSNYFVIMNSSNQISTGWWENEITDAPDNYEETVNSATESTIQVGTGINANYMFDSGKPYDWFAIGGLS